MLHDPAQPHRRGVFDFSSLAHQGRHEVVGGLPRPFDLGGPLRSGDLGHRVEQGSSKHVVMLADYAELAVIAPELAQEDREVLGPIDGLQHMDESSQEPGALGTHGDREQVARIGAA